MKPIAAKAACSLLSLSMLVGLSAPALAADIDGHWAQRDLQSFVDNGYLTGDSSGNFLPDNAMTQAEFAALLEQTTGLTAEASDSQTFTREQAFVLLAQALQLEDGDASALAAFRDGAQVSASAQGSVAALVSAGIVSGSNGDLNPGGRLTRAEAVTLLARSADLLPNAGGVPVSEVLDGEYKYIMMNIPYGVFYAADLAGTETALDAVSSATKSKPANSGLTAGSYHTADNSEITGVTFPVAVAPDFDLSGYEKVADVDALFAAASYAYCELDSVPYSCKILTENNGERSFSAVQGVVQEQSGVTAKLTDSTTYGDYQVNVSGLSDPGTVYGVVLHTASADYGLRHLENIWRNTELAWSAGFVTVTHGCPLSYDHYVSLMGQTITGMTYYTEHGVWEFPVELYVPVKFEHTLSVANADITSGSAAVTMTGFPSDYDAVYTVTDAGRNELTSAACDGKTLTWTEAKQGAYTMTVKDASGKYASFTASFELQTSAQPAQFDASVMALTASEGTSDADFQAYLSAISSVSVDGTAYAASGRGATSIVNAANGFVDLSAAPFREMTAGKTYSIEVTATGYSNKLTFTLTVPETIYAYAALSYPEYWANEGIALSGGDYAASAEGTDCNSESDLGAFDAVTRATTNHGWHRASFQQDAVILTDDGKELDIAYWTDATSVVLASGSTGTYDKEAKTLSYQEGRSTTTVNVTGYEVRGIKYVPVAVSAQDFPALCAAYTVTVNGGTMTGGFSEQQLTAYTNLTAYVTADTNGLKAATLTDGVWSFGARQTGSGSGLWNTELAQAVNVTESVVSESKFGDFLRVDLTGDGYGALGSRMQTVVWSYYGDTDPASAGAAPLATYGTKFAADNWMHKSMGIQLGLTDSLRCQLPENASGAGYWTVTVYALGYADYTVTVPVSETDLHGSTFPMSEAQRTQLTALKEQAEALLTGYDANSAGEAQKSLKEHYDEAVALLANAGATQAEAAELVGELPALIEAVTAS